MPVRGEPNRRPMPNRSARRLLLRHRPELLAIDLPAAWRLLARCRSPHLRYDVAIRLLVAARLQSRGAPSDPAPILGALGRPDFGSIDADAIAFRHPTHDHAIMIELKEGRMTLFGTLPWSHFLESRSTPTA